MGRQKEASEISMYDDHEERDRGGFRVAAGVFDFLGVILNAFLILLLLVIMTTLFSWLRQDLSDTFASIGENINEAVFIDGEGNRQEAAPQEGFAPAATEPPQVLELQAAPQG